MRPALRARLVAGVALLVLLTLTPLRAQGQVQPTVSLSADDTSFTLDPGDSVTATITVTSQCSPAGNQACGDVMLTLDGAATGWTAALDRTSVPPGGTERVTLTVRAPAGRDSVEDAFSVQVTGTLTSQAPGTTPATDRVQFESALTAAPPPPPPPPPPDYTWLYLLLAAGLVAAAVIGTLALVWWRRERGIELLAPLMEKEARPGYDAFVPLEVRNVSRRPRVAKVYTEDVPSGWAAGTSLATIPLEPGQSESLWLAVRPPLDAAAGTTTIAVIAKPAEARGAKPLGINIRVVSDAPVLLRAGTDLVAPIHHRAGRPESAPPDSGPGAQP